MTDDTMVLVNLTRVKYMEHGTDNLILLILACLSHSKFLRTFTVVTRTQSLS